MFIIAVAVGLVFAGPIEDLNNDPKATWKATEYPPEVITLESMKSKLMPLSPSQAAKNRAFVPTTLVEAAEAFDARDVWQDLFLPVRDQASCGGCWAFAIAETAGIRIGIAQGKSDGVYSPQSLISCDTRNGGCGGASSGLAWEYVVNTGIAYESCLPYTSGNGETGTCPRTCANGSAIVRRKAKRYYQVHLDQYQEELTTNGPFEVGMEVYEDFMSYKEGIYQHTWGNVAGAHAVLLVGWGVKDGVKFWTVQNSWSANWGVNGYFYILRGTNESSLESMDAFAGVF